MGLSVCEFWEISPPEFWAAFNGWQRANVSKPKTGGGSLTDEDKERLLELARADRARRSARAN